MKKILLKSIIITILLEIMIFNVTTITTFIRTIGKEEKEYLVEDLNYFVGEDSRTVYEIRDINEEVESIFIDFEDNIERAVDYNYAYSDDTSDGLRYLDHSKVYTYKYKRTEYMSTHFSGKVKALDVNVDYKITDFGDEEEFNQSTSSDEINIQTVDVNEEKNIEIIHPISKVVINKVIPFDFVIPRIIVVFLIVFIVTMIRNTKLFGENYDKRNVKQEVVLMMCIYVTFFLLFTLSMVTSQNSFSESGLELYTKEFIEALNKGQVHLDIPVTDELYYLENPYDQIVRDETILRDEDYHWDTAYYKGKYYIYFGILPAITLLLPFYKITGIFMTSGVAILIYEFLSLILLVNIFEKILDKFFKGKEIEFKVVFDLCLILCFGTLFFYIMGIPRMYELVIIAGVYAVLQSIYFVFKAFEKDESKVNFIYLFLASLFMAGAIAARPTQIFMSVIIGIIGIKLLIKFIKGKDIKSIIKLVLSIGIPYIVIATLLMIYNYERFENVLEFGSSYQLTVNNMKEIKTGLVSSVSGVITNLFNLPQFTMDFPFLLNNNNVLTYYGYYYYENMIAGAFFIVPLLFILFDIVKFNKNKNVNIVLKVIVDVLLVVSIIMAMLNSAMGGSTGRYIVDYMWILVVISEIMYLSKYTNLKEKESKDIYKKILKYITIYVIVFAILSGIVSEKSRFYENAGADYFAFKYMISFWQ